MTTTTPWPQEIIDIANDKLAYSVFQFSSALDAVIYEYSNEYTNNYPDCISRAFWWLGRTEYMVEIIDIPALSALLKVIVSQLFSLNDTVNTPAVIKELKKLRAELDETYTD